MGRILLYAVIAVAAFFVIGWLIGLVFGLLKWVLILGLIGLAVMGVMKLTSGKGKSPDWS
ncbi:hypothetical protein GT755_25315 [Herbidospora sp. NEAU-GS84]|uniref:Uncharacterized protein n=1 Tax=Herbidospora solisilvae TaxID=2696284 RepID=A0A7C9MZP2_9ACTN|nr:hypothetical protein [Herbidospora solisilvae]NAS24991.1 hypothetical protein [Herbidospora solisilvae]